MKKVSYIPEGYNAVIPALAFHGADAAIKWYVNNLGAKEKMRFNAPDGTIAHAEITVGDDVIMLAEENLQYNRSPQTLKAIQLTSVFMFRMWMPLLRKQLATELNS